MDRLQNNNLFQGEEAGPEEHQHRRVSTRELAGILTPVERRSKDALPEGPPLRDVEQQKPIRPEPTSFTQRSKDQEDTVSPLHFLWVENALEIT